MSDHNCTNDKFESLLQGRSDCLRVRPGAYKVGDLIRVVNILNRDSLLATVREVIGANGVLLVLGDVRLLSFSNTWPAETNHQADTTQSKTDWR
jgi:hypothetical protein